MFRIWHKRLQLERNYQNSRTKRLSGLCRFSRKTSCFWWKVCRHASLFKISGSVRSRGKKMVVHAQSELWKMWAQFGCCEEQAVRKSWFCSSVIRSVWHGLQQVCCCEVQGHQPRLRWTFFYRKQTFYIFKSIISSRMLQCWNRRVVWGTF